MTKIILQGLPGREQPKEKKHLAQAYKEASEDEDMNKEIELWDQSLKDVLDESNEK